MTEDDHYDDNDSSGGDVQLRIANTSPYIYVATFFFALSALSSDLLLIRFSLMNGFVFLVLASWSGHSKDGSFSTDSMPFVDGTIDIPLVVNTLLFGLNFLIVLRLIDDERIKTKLTSEQQALYRFFHCRCGVTRLEFDEILRHGHFLELKPNRTVPRLDSTLYLVCEGLVECKTSYDHNNQQGGEDITTTTTQAEGQARSSSSDIFIKRSGQFFDIKLFNVFTLPIGFDSFQFEAKTICRTRLFGWTIHGLVAMRDSHSPCLQPYWEYMVLRVLSASAVRHHLRQDKDTLYDAWLIPEEEDWLEGAPSRDFGKPTQLAEGCCCTSWRVLQHQLQQIYQSLWQIIPPKGIRHGRPSMVVKRNPKQDCIELMAKAKQDCIDLLKEAKSTSKDFRFLSTSSNLPPPPPPPTCLPDSSEIDDNNNHHHHHASQEQEETNDNENHAGDQSGEIVAERKTPRSLVMEA